MKDQLFKELIVLGVWVGIISVFNWVLLLSLHDLSYYYTWQGLKLVSIVIGAEVLLTFRPAIKQLEKIEKLWTNEMEVENWKRGA